MKKITVAHITDRATFPGVQINHIEEIELDNVSGLAGRFPLASMSLCFNAVMKAWDDILKDDEPIDYEEDK